MDTSKTMDRDARTRARLEQHWQASERGDIETEHAIYAADAILDYPQSGERFRGQSKIRAQRGGHPAERHFTILRILGGGDLWVSECVITYDGVPTYSVEPSASPRPRGCSASTGREAVRPCPRHRNHDQSGAPMS
jgi:hypothetical protein